MSISVPIAMLGWAGTRGPAHTPGEEAAGAAGGCNTGFIAGPGETGETGLFIGGNPKSSVESPKAEPSLTRAGREGHPRRGTGGE